MTSKKIENRIAPESQRTSVSTGAFRFTRTDRLAARPTKDRDQRLKIDADPQDALRALVKTQRATPAKPEKRDGK